MRKLLRFWPVYLLVLVHGLAWYNVDYFGVPTLLGLGFSRKVVLLIAGTWGFADILGAYIGWSRFREMVFVMLQEDGNFMKKVSGEIAAEGIFEKIKVWLARKHFGLDDKTVDCSVGGPFPFLDRIKNKIWRVTLKVLKGGSWSLIFLIGFLPVPGLRLGSDVICGTMRWWKQFLIIALGNFVKTACFVYGLHHLFF